VRGAADPAPRLPELALLEGVARFLRARPDGRAGARDRTGVCPRLSGGRRAGGSGLGASRLHWSPFRITVSRMVCRGGAVLLAQRGSPGDDLVGAQGQGAARSALACRAQARANPPVTAGQEQRRAHIMDRGPLGTGSLPVVLLMGVATFAPAEEPGQGVRTLEGHGGSVMAVVFS